MSGHHNFDHAVHEGNLWLRKVAERLHFDDDRHAYSALRASLHALRDRLTPENAVHLAAQLPMVIRGLFFEGWRMSRTPTDEATVEAFCAHIAAELPARFPIDARAVATGVFDVVWTELDVGEVAKVIDRMPPALKTLWPWIAQRPEPVRDHG
jgi:uncharacterized protein (DUF2267 family)